MEDALADRGMGLFDFDIETTPRAGNGRQLIAQSSHRARPERVPKEAILVKSRRDVRHGLVPIVIGGSLIKSSPHN